MSSRFKVGAGGRLVAHAAYDKHMKIAIICPCGPTLSMLLGQENTYFVIPVVETDDTEYRSIR